MGRRAEAEHRAAAGDAGHPARRGGAARLDGRHHPGHVPALRLPPGRDPRAGEHPPPDRRGGRREREADLQGPQARGEARPLRAATEADLVDLGLRFDLTVPLARYYAHNHARLPKPLKAVQIGSVWRAERPQKGRFRQFTQCDIDILGVRSEVAEIELILATTEALGALGLEDLTVRINDRRILTAMARWCGFDEERHESLFIALDKWDKLGAGRDRGGAAAGRSSRGGDPAGDRAVHRAEGGGRSGAAAGPPPRLRHAGRHRRPEADHRGRADAGAGPLRRDARAGHVVLHGADLRDPVVPLPVLHRRRRAIRQADREDPGPGRAGHRVLHRVRAGRVDPDGARERPGSHGEAGRVALRRGQRRPA